MSFVPRHIVARNDAIILETALMLAADGEVVSVGDLVTCLNRAGRFTETQVIDARLRLLDAKTWPANVVLRSEVADLRRRRLDAIVLAVVRDLVAASAQPTAANVARRLGDQGVGIGGIRASIWRLRASPDWPNSPARSPAASARPIPEPLVAREPEPESEPVPPLVATPDADKPPRFLGPFAADLERHRRLRKLQRPGPRMGGVA